VRNSEEFIFPLTHFFAFPTDYSVIDYGLRRIWYYLVFLYSDSLTISFARSTGTVRTIKIEKLWSRFFKKNSIQFETDAEFNQLCAFGLDITFALALM
jgi:hypothetical protein